MMDLSAAKDLAIKAAIAAATIQKQFLGSDLRIEMKTSARDLVTKVDKESQAIIIETIRKEYPNHRFIAEEEGAESLGDPASPYIWIIDPLDGTTNYLHGNPDFGVLIALQENEEIVMGVMLETLTGKISHASKGGGAFHDEQRIRVRKTNGMMDAILCTNILKRPNETEAGTLQQITVPICGSIHNYGCALTEMREVAMGHNDGVFFDGLGLWDIAPGCILIAEAGGRYRIEPRDSKNLKEGYKCVASTEEVFEELCELVFEK